MACCSHALQLNGVFNKLQTFRAIQGERRLVVGSSIVRSVIVFLIEMFGRLSCKTFLAIPVNLNKFAGWKGSGMCTIDR